jgi:tRNA-splicing ligase RtcB
MHTLIYEPDAGQRVPVLIWARDPARETVRQLQQIASQPYVVEHVAAMPDAHVAHGVAVGTVFATLETVVPGALGGDLGCGMSAVRFSVPAATLDRRRLEEVLTALGRAIPVGSHLRSDGELPDALRAGELSTQKLERMRERIAPRHLGTLGGGNHFLELERGGGGDLWMLVHSGSRGPGGAIFAHHQEVAGGGLAGLPIHSPAGRAYVNDVDWALAFARANRAALVAHAVEVIVESTGADYELIADVHHNFVAREVHGGQELIIHRKGATSAQAGEIGIVPGSMGTASYLVRGRGAPASFASSAHGAGRVMSRSEARSRLRPSELEQAMKRVVFDRRRLRSLIEESPHAYRDIGEVLEDQADLVEPFERLTPIAVLKG